MSDSLLALLEMIEEEIVSERMMATQIPSLDTEQGEIGYIKSSDKKKQATSGILNVKRIVDSIVSTTESETAEADQAISDSFAILREFNREKINNISDAQTLNDAIVSFYENTSSGLDGKCRDFSTVAKRALINAAYSKILNDFNASAAGFVNEAYLANLLGGEAKTVPTNSKVMDTPFNDIADLTFGNMGISLKTKAGGVKGSLRDLMATLGIPFDIEGGKKAEQRVSLNTTPAHPAGLFYVIFGKQQSKDNYFDVSTALITREEILSFLGEQKNVQIIDGIVKTNSKTIGELEKKSNFILGATKMYAKLADVRGVGGFANHRLEFEPSQEFNKKQAQKLGQELTTTLNTLNSYISEIEKTIVRYAADPTKMNLESLQKQLQMLSDFQIASLLVC